MKFSADEVLSRDRYGLLNLANRIAERSKRGAPTDKIEAKLRTLYDASHAAYLARKAALPQPKLDADLPVIEQKDHIKNLIRDNQVVIISGETGSGKTTQLPQICLDLGLGARGMIAHTQPRRIAARSVSERIAEELNVPLGDAVGYQVRFDEKTSANTVIKLMTDGMLLAETLSDKFLSNYEVIIVDEAHERSLNIDFLLGYLHQLLKKRSDLKLIITSATIDSEKFAKHFGNAPMINVSGRTYPVEIRYQPPLEDEDTNAAILHAIDSLDAEHRGRRGDVLVFLPTERDIRDAADYLRRADLPGTDILPLFGRLSLAEQQAVFHPKAQRRIVLATNVAETSLTVPRIKYVIDTGTARISRYSLRTKTQRLPIEAISQASANQRAGRCGRVSAGICVRLYSEEDFNNREAFTEAEILRTNLAAVILQMLVLRLGDVEDFPFVDSPDQRQINDGYRLLFELQAVDSSNHLTSLGRRMALLPIDPRFARIVFAAEKRHVVQEALIVLAALSLQDPRERPFGVEQQADQRQNEFADAKSDFQTLLNLFAAYESERKALSNSRLRAWCKSYFLNAQRMREWRELVNQLVRESRSQKIHLEERQPVRLKIASDDVVKGSKGSLGFDNPNIESLHLALLSGFLDQVGLWDEQNKDYNGPRNRKFSIFPGSVLAKKHPQAVMAASIVEISRTFARCCAPVNLFELETLAAHLTKTHYSNPHWSKRAGNVMAEESILLYGLPIVAGRKKPFAAHDMTLAHEIFVQEALVTGEIQTKVKAIAENLALLAELETLEDKTRSRGIIVDEQTMADFYFAKLPESVYSVVTLEQWVKAHGEAALKMTRADLLQDEAEISSQEYPESINIRGQHFALEYAFNPGGDADGVSVLVPIASLNALQAQDFERLVPGMLEEKIEALLRRLPKVWRRQLVPIPDFARAVHERLREDKTAPLIPAITQAIQAMKGISIPEEAFDAEKIDAHYLMNFQLIDGNKKLLAQARDLAALQAQYSETAHQQFTKRTRNKATEDAVSDWAWDNLPVQEKLSGGVLAYPALTATASGKLYLRLYDDPQQAQFVHREGVLALLTSKLAQQLKYLQKNLPDLNTMSLYYRKIVAGSQTKDVTLSEDIARALLDRVCLADGVPRTRKAFYAALARGKTELIAAANTLSKQLLLLLKEYSAANEALRSCKQKAPKADMQKQMARLIFPGFVRETPQGQLTAITRYLKGINKRLEKLQREPLKDALRERDIAPWEDKLEAWLTREKVARATQSNNAHLQEYFYLLEEYRLQVFAQEVGSEKVSEKILEKALAQ